ncbi:hypothetical protein PP459_gp023 [Streptomyces phage Wakanda]|uniref:Uncharacterized protein n=1 Tax=Streptomyces phage Wakanda TaxID=2713267 RepID=A0A6G8R1X6_9CAUD|nr:hypothetical protein PP459_gp023 [Streptomyces phage Wakanda]QIN94210.1 hypothetical protein SEA_WAKANDA_250 [Streptomyces phage Wakanda]
MTTAKTATVKRVRSVKVDESQDDPQNTQGWAFKAPAKRRGWKSSGAVSLTRYERLSDRARANLIELATEGNTDQAKAYWTRILRDRYGITV